MINEDRLPVEDRPRSLSLRPGLGGDEVAPLALRGAPHPRFRRAERAHDLGMVAAKAADHVKRRDRDGAQRKSGIARKRGFENADWIAGQPVIVGDRAIKGRSRLGRAGELEPLLILGH